ncbi:MAG TPA: nitroreductase family protein [Thermoanaerobaculia bacterium]|nr:nitroreductase family protein [Thermoanaerobaculia bacterium]
MSEPFPHVPYRRERLSPDRSVRAAREFAETAFLRRSVREFSPDPVPEDAVRLAIAAANSAPSGANVQPWTFVLVRNPELKRRIREAAENEERENYSWRMPPPWLRALAPLGTDWRKEFLETAPLLIVVFRSDFHQTEHDRVLHYYVSESVGIACGFLLAALNAAGLSTLTHTPSPMGFLREILDRPASERPFLLIPVGYAAEGCTVPDIRKKGLAEVLVER